MSGKKIIEVGPDEFTSLLREGPNFIYSIVNFFCVTPNFFFGQHLLTRII